MYIQPSTHPYTHSLTLPLTHPLPSIHAYPLPSPSKHKAQLSGVCRHVYCWENNRNISSSDSSDRLYSSDSYRNGVAVLCDGMGGVPVIDLFFLDAGECVCMHI